MKKETHLLRKQVRRGRLEPRRDDGSDDGPLLGHVGVPVARGDKGPGEGARERGHFLFFLRPSSSNRFFFSCEQTRVFSLFLSFVFLAPSRYNGEG